MPARTAWWTISRVDEILHSLASLSDNWWTTSIFFTSSPILLWILVRWKLGAVMTSCCYSVKKNLQSHTSLKYFFVNLSLPSGSKTIFRSQVMNQSISYTYSVFTKNSPFCLPAKLLEKLMNLDEKFQPIYLKKCVQNNCLFVKYSLLIAR